MLRAALLRIVIRILWKYSKRLVPSLERTISLLHETIHIPYQDTHCFSNLVTDYLAGDKKLDGFFQFAPNEKGIREAIETRKSYPVNRTLLVQTIRQRYAPLNRSKKLQANIEALLKEDTFTVCTAHQPNLLTGYLYFIYKIVHAIKLAELLSEQYPDKRFVPVYYMGSEDNDLEELGTFRYNGKRYTWDANGQKGAVGRMQTESLKPLLNELFRTLGPPGEKTEQLKDLLARAYLQHDTIAAATHYLVNELFGEYGLIVLNPDEAQFKQLFTTIMQDDLLQGTAEGVVKAQMEQLSVHYKTQAFPRPINLFYLTDTLRERIVHQEGTWSVLHTNITFTQEALLHELQTYPERFSPNVVLRGLFQETLLPNVAFIGGGAEVAYWLQLKPLFEYYQVFYPVLLLRQSVQWITPIARKKMKQASLSVSDIFTHTNDWVQQLIVDASSVLPDTTQAQQEISSVLFTLKDKAVAIDGTLADATDATIKKTKRLLESLQTKMWRAEKRKHAIAIARLEKVKSLLLPNGALQERVENFIEFYPYLGDAFIKQLYASMEPLRNEFLVLHADYPVSR